MPPGQAIAMVRPELAGVTYTATMWSKKPRGATVESRPMTEDSGLLQLARNLPDDPDRGVARENPYPGQADLYQNKAPKWNEQIGAFVLNFNKRVTAASVKNFQLVSAENPDVVYLQFGRAGKESFTMDVRHPMSIVQAFGMVLSSFDYKICCE